MENTSKGSSMTTNLPHLVIAFGIWAMLSAAQAAAPAPSAYAAQETRDIKALSAEEVDGLLAGKGQGLAKAAELNGYPGPSHVLALSSQLGLMDEQRRLTEALFEAMQAKAVSLGQALVDHERKLDRLFSNRSATPDAVSATLADIGALQAKLRDAHLEAHIAQRHILTPDQVAAYAHLRGYASGATPDAERHHHPNAEPPVESR